MSSNACKGLSEHQTARARFLLACAVRGKLVSVDESGAIEVDLFAKSPLNPFPGRPVPVFARSPAAAPTAPLVLRRFSRSVPVHAIGTHGRGASRQARPGPARSSAPSAPRGPPRPEADDDGPLAQCPACGEPFTPLAPQRKNCYREVCEAERNRRKVAESRARQRRSDERMRSSTAKLRAEIDEAVGRRQQIWLELPSANGSHGDLAYEARRLTGFLNGHADDVLDIVGQKRNPGGARHDLRRAIAIRHVTQTDIEYEELAEAWEVWRDVHGRAGMSA